MINASSFDDKNVSRGPVYGSKDWANHKLRWFLNEVLYADVWIQHPYCKLAVGYEIIDQLESHGFWWQAERIRNHLHRWMSKIACTAEGRDTLDDRERRETS